MTWGHSIPELQDPLARAQQRNAERRQKGRNGKRGPAAGPRQGEGDSEDEEEDAEFDFERRPRSSRDFTGMEEGGLPIKTAHGIMHMPHGALSCPPFTWLLDPPLSPHVCLCLGRDGQEGDA